MAIGDVNSVERGSGARFNDGKIKMEYIPADIVWQHGQFKNAGRMHEPHEASALDILYHLSVFEEGDDGAIVAVFNDIPEDHRWRSTCEQFDFGAKKYAAWNWAKGMKWSVPIACIKRHCMALLDGELIDPESGVSHFGAVGCNVVMLMHYVDHYREGDDRPPKEYFSIEEQKLDVYDPSVVLTPFYTDTR